MKDKIYLYSQKNIQEFIKRLLCDFEVISFGEQSFLDTNFKNKNVLIVDNKKRAKSISESFLSNNNTLFFFLKNEKTNNEENKTQVKSFYGPIRIKNFFDNVKTYFYSNTIFYKDINIVGENITNVKNGLSASLTPLEKKILYELVEKKKTKREFFLEEILKIKKDIKTKTIESHFTRIRKKLLIIKNKIQIFSKDDTFYLED